MRYVLIVLFTAAIVTVFSFLVAAYLIRMPELMLALPGAIACGLIIALREYDENKKK